MSELPPASSPEPAAPSTGPRRWRVRPAAHADVEAVALAVRELLLELDGAPPALAAMQATTRTLIDSPWAGAVLVAHADEPEHKREHEHEQQHEQQPLVGVLAASWQLAIHVPGSYALIQDLWVERAWRGRAVGAGLLAALFELARARRVTRVEVGLPREGFAGFAATEAFYLGNGFTANGPRMRRILT